MNYLINIEKLDLINIDLFTLFISFPNPPISEYTTATKKQKRQPNQPKSLDIIDIYFVHTYISCSFVTKKVETSKKFYYKFLNKRITKTAKARKEKHHVTIRTNTKPNQRRSNRNR